MKETLEKRSRIIFEIRNFFFKNNYTEVETPLRLPSIIPEDHIEPFLSEKFFLQASPEICMKRLLAKGHEKIFQICKAFRKNERGRFHIPEMTMLEWYQAGKNYFDIMEETQELIIHLAKTFSIKKITRQNKDTSLDKNFERLSVYDAVKKYTNRSFNEVLNNFDEIFGMEICPRLGFGRPVFLYDFPASQASLSKLCENSKNFCQRFELFISGVEICNCYTELTDASEQEKRFKDSINFRQKKNLPVSDLPYKFLKDLDNMPDASGNALGIDRLIMVLLNKEKIDDVLSFTPEEL
ncbi:MAG: EF-P lysine aminoacylase GenX [Desulfobacteraceae bacterium]|nr:EF-P lysine aminoacylase GenX [Desulfobacteraceae bacterium]MCB9494757.1 EF-P lysine aminoacylase GenX [Desulfobacteraceae bacterium]